jgi:hypothetical protein
MIEGEAAARCRMMKGMQRRMIYLIVWRSDADKGEQNAAKDDGCLKKTDGIACLNQHG